MLTIMAFYSHHDTIDDVLMFNFPIPGYESEAIHQSDAVAIENIQNMIETIYEQEEHLQKMIV